jgi:hypothetical protein
LSQQIGVATLVTEAMIGSGQIVITVRIFRVSCHDLLELLQRSGILALLVQLRSGRILAACGPLATACKQ